jgi:beta-lactamase class D
VRVDTAGVPLLNILNCRANETKMAIRLLTLFLVVALPTLLNSCASSKEDAEVDLSKFFDEYQVKGSFILFDKKNNQFTRYDRARCREQFTPASTFKIPNSLIAIEERIIDDAQTILKWDSIKSINPLWNRELTFTEAFRLSCVPCYIKIANKIGDTRYKHYLEVFNYGNRSTEIPTEDPNLKMGFWLIGKLKISQEEQIAFLRKLYDYKLPVARRSIAIVKEILVDEKNYKYTLSGKLGRGTDQASKKDIGWYVGYVEKDDNVFFFATNFESSSPLDSFGPARKDITLKILRKFKIIE